MADDDPGYQSEIQDYQANGHLDMFESTGHYGEAYQRRTGVHRFNIPVDLMDQMIESTSSSKAILSDTKTTGKVESSEVEPNATEPPEPTLHFNTPPKEFSARRARLELARTDEQRANVARREAITEKEQIKEKLEKAKQDQKRLCDWDAPESMQQMAARDVHRLLQAEKACQDRLEAALQLHAKAQEDLKAMQEGSVEESARMKGLKNSLEAKAGARVENEKEAEDVEMADVGQ